MIKKKRGRKGWGGSKYIFGPKHSPSGMEYLHTILMHVLHMFRNKCQAYNHIDLHTDRHLWDFSSSEVEILKKIKKKTNTFKTSKQISVSSL